jgi:hypothetical protein
MAYCPRPAKCAQTLAGVLRWLVVLACAAAACRSTAFRSRGVQAAARARVLGAGRLPDPAGTAAPARRAHAGGSGRSTIPGGGSRELAVRALLSGPLRLRGGCQEECAHGGGGAALEAHSVTGDSQPQGPADLLPAAQALCEQAWEGNAV